MQAFVQYILKSQCVPDLYLFMKQESDLHCV